MSWQWVGWFYDEAAGQRVGPVNEVAIAALLRSAQLRPTSHVWKAWQGGEKLRIFHSEARVAVGEPYQE